MIATEENKKIRTSARSATRFWEVDMMRGVAIVMMAIFHLLWDFWSFRIMPDLILYAGFWKYFQRTTAITFLVLVGVSLTLSYRREVGKNRGRKPGWDKYLLRGLRIFGIGMCFTFFGWLSRFGYVHIGILHLIGLAIILSYPLLEYRWINFILWVIFVIIGGIVLNVRLDHNWLVYFGLHTERYYPLDYFPLFPWLGVVLLGVFVGNTLYDRHGRIFYLPDWQDIAPIRLLRFLGRHSLIIYVIHQPLLIAILYLLDMAGLINSAL